MAFGSAHFGAGVGTIRKFICRGTESRLNQCSSSTCRYPWYRHYYYNAAHTNDAGVRCQGSFTFFWKPDI